MAGSKLFRQVGLKPATYEVAKGVRQTYSRDELKSYVDGTRAALAMGKRISVFLEHPKPGIPEGGPLDEHDKRAQRLKNTVGKLVAIDQDDDGAMSYVLEIKDDQVANQIADGRIRFTSPELRPQWADGKGGQIQKVVAHVALTNNPRSLDQGEFEFADAADAPALQFSLADIVEERTPVSKKKKAAAPAQTKTKKKASAGLIRAISTAIAQFADDEEDDDKPSDDAPVDGDGDGKTNEDEPADDDLEDVVTPGDSDSLKSVLAALANYDIVLPEDTSPDTFLTNLTAALTALAAVKDKLEGEPNEPDPGETYMPQEEVTPRQFSLSDASGKLKKANPVLAKLISQSAASVEHQIAGMASRGLLAPEVAADLRKSFTTVQFSQTGDEQATFTLPQVLGLLAKNSKALTGFAGSVQFGETDEPDHPGGERFFSGDWGPKGPPEGSARHKELVDQMKDAIPRRR